MYYTINVSAGLELPSANFASIGEGYFKSTLAVIILFYSSLWSIKISFLLFFRRLGTNVKHQKLIWWPVFGFTIATYFACIGSIQYPCLVRSFMYLAANCATPSATSFQQDTLKLNCAWDVATDFFSKFIELPWDVANTSTVMLIPITMLWGVQMKRGRKAALAGIFSLVVITMIFAIVRTAVVGSVATHLPDSSWLYMWSAIETSVGKQIMHLCYADSSSNTGCVAIIVACLASFRNLFSRENSRSQPKRYEPPNSSNIFLRGTKSRSRMRNLIDTLASDSDYPHSSYQVQVDGGNDTRSTIDHHNESRDQLKSEKVVHVRRDVDLVHESSQVWEALTKIMIDLGVQRSMGIHLFSSIPIYSYLFPFILIYSHLFL